MKTIKARNLDEASEFAEQFRRDGSYDCFRGQADSNWGVQSSFERLSPTERKEAEQRVVRFANWMVQSSEVMPYITDDNQILAIAQHYGLKTPLIDFTREPKVAAFFATHQRGRAACGSIFMIK